MAPGDQQRLGQRRAKPHGHPASKPSLLAGRQPVLELLRSGRGAQRILVAQDAAPSPSVAEIRRRAQEAAIPLRVAPRMEIDKLVGGVHHQGVVAITERYRYTPLKDILAKDGRGVLFLDGVMDPHNLGSLLRSADGAGFDGLVIPARRATAVTDVVRRVSAGASEVVSVARVSSLGGALEEARSAGLWVVGLDERAEHDLWSSESLEPPVALVVGAEDRGLSRAVAARCDALVRIPSAGRLASLNVSVAGAIAMFESARRAEGSDTL